MKKGQRNPPPLTIGQAAQHAWNLLGAGKWADAEATAHRVLAAAPGHSLAMAVLGHLAGRRGDYHNAERLLLGATTAGPQNPEILSDLGIVYAIQNRLTEAAKVFQQVLHIAPDHRGALTNLANVFNLTGLPRPATELYSRLLELDPTQIRARQNLLLCLNYVAGLQREEIFAAHREFGRFHRRATSRPPPTDPTPTRRLRVGYLSGDFRMHPVGYFFISVLAGHQRDQVECICIATDARRDALSEHFKRLADGWIDGHQLNDDALAALIQDHKIDVLVDLAGHTEGSRLGVFFRRPSPVQVSYLGYANTTGMDCFDARIVDEQTEPAGAEAFSSEALVRVAGGYFCYTAPEFSPAVSPPPSSTTGHITLGVFCHLAKVTDPTLALWREVLDAIPDARLLIGASSLADGPTRAAFLDRVRAKGIVADRVDLRGPLPLAQHLARYAEVDIGLDTFPFNLATNTCEALWMGVPVVSLVGDRHVSRLGLSILTAAGLPDLACASTEDFVARCRTLAGSDLPALRASLRDRLRSAPLCDGRRVAAALEGAYRDAWQRCCVSAHANP